ncbi:MAG: flagellum-specific ATP synthase FliI, partial [Pseudomonadota bacterium]
GAGVGKSSLLAMIAKNMECDVAIIALVGERGREVREFVEDHLGADGLSRSIVIAETADAPAMMRREVGYLAHTLAEHFRDNGAHVLCLMDSITRIAIAQREIGLAAGEPPTAKGYTPSVFSTLSALIERSGPGSDGPQPGFITAIYSVLVEGDDIDEPVADAARSILDGHIVLDRTLAQSGQFPPIDIQRSVSRTASAASTPDELKTSNRARKLAAIYENTRELVRIGAYKAGSDPETDRAIAFYPRLAALLTQSINQCADPTSAFLALDEIIKEVEMAYE